MPHKLSVEDLEALNVLVQDGLIEVVSVDPDGTPYYRIASRFSELHEGPRAQARDPCRSVRLRRVQRIADTGYRADVRGGTELRA
jgi:hypothetical protein